MIKRLMAAKVLPAFSPVALAGVFARKAEFLMLLFLSIAMAQTASAGLIDVGPQTSTYTGNTRGYYFVAPTDFTVVGLGVAADASNANFDVSLIRLSSIPPLFSANTTDFTTLFISRDNAGTGLLPANIDVSNGDIIGVLGSRGTNSVNSYGSNPYSSTILGQSISLNRLLMQADLRSTDPSAVGVSGENSSSFGRVLLDVEAQQAVPAPATLALFGLGLAGLGWRRRKDA